MSASDKTGWKCTKRCFCFADSFHLITNTAVALDFILQSVVLILYSAMQKTVKTQLKLTEIGPLTLLIVTFSSSAFRFRENRMTNIKFPSVSVQLKLL